jgi:diaminopimelate epimerase
MIFYKTVSAGNDFLHIDVKELNVQKGNGRVSRGHLAGHLCQYKTGAGADGVVYYTVGVGEKGVNFEIFNRDGDEAELSGNGMAGLSALLFYLGTFKDQVTLNTRVGQKTHQLLQRNENNFKLKIEIGEPDFYNTAFFPFLEKKKMEYTHKNIRFYPVSVGNPHVVVLLDRKLPDETLNRMGEMLESATIFPQKTNVELVFYKNEENCRLFYYERGVGRTLSSSTGSAAVFAVLQKLKFIQNQLFINTPEGKIKIYGKRGVYIENFTKIVYKGIYLSGSK